MDRVARALSEVNLAGRGLEIGPSYSPMVPKSSGRRIETVDHATREELVAKYRVFDLPQEKIDQIEEVDYLWQGGSLLGVVPDHGGYDYIVASHFIEHTVDLILFLQDCEALLAENGRLALVIPDKRYCFDRFQALTTVGAVIDGHLFPHRFHPPAALVDHQAYACSRGDAIAWSVADHNPLSLQNPRLEGAAEATAHGLAQDEYYDTHRWKFTPRSFDLLIADLAALGYHSLVTVTQFPTEGFEFFVTLGKEVTSQAQSTNRLEALLAIEEELGAPILADLRHENLELRGQLSALRSSTSWSVTRPLRAAGSLLSRLGRAPARRR